MEPSLSIIKKKKTFEVNALLDNPSYSIQKQTNRPELVGLWVKTSAPLFFCVGPKGQPICSKSGQPMREPTALKHFWAAQCPRTVVGLSLFPLLRVKFSPSKVGTHWRCGIFNLTGYKRTPELKATTDFVRGIPCGLLQEKIAPV